MLKTKLLHPEILSALGSAGHGSKVLIADGNYPFSTGSSPKAKKVFLNLMPGVPTCTQVLEALESAINIEAAEVMVPPEGPPPPIFAEFEKILPEGIELKSRGRNEFYSAAREKDIALIISTGEQRIYANLLLTIGVRMP